MTCFPCVVPKFRRRQADTHSHAVSIGKRPATGHDIRCSYGGLLGTPAPRSGGSDLTVNRTSLVMHRLTSLCQKLRHCVRSDCCAVLATVCETISSHGRDTDTLALFYRWCKVTCPLLADESPAFS